MFTDFLNELKQKEILISFSGGKLKYSGPEDNVTPEIINKLKEYKPKLIKYFWPAECHNLMPINTEGTKSPFFLVHGDQTNYYLSEHFGQDQPFYGFFHYGSDGKKNKHKKLRDYIEDYINQLQVVAPEGPYMFGGFSFGGILAFEIAIELQLRGFEVSKLILIDCGIAPSKKSGSKDGNNKSIKLSKVICFPKRVWLKIYHDSWKWYFSIYHNLGLTLPDKYRKKYIAGKYHESMKRYSPARAFAGDILLFKASENKSMNKYLGWDEYCTNIKMITIKGDHDTIKKIDESIESLKTNILAWISETAKNSASQKIFIN